MFYVFPKPKDSYSFLDKIPAEVKPHQDEVSASGRAGSPETLHQDKEVGRAGSQQECRKIRGRDFVDCDP